MLENEKKINTSINNARMEFEKTRRTLENIILQRQMHEAEINEIDEALKELDKIDEKSKVYQNIGVILVEKDKEETKQLLLDKKVLLTTLTKNLRRQEKELREKLRDLEEKINIYSKTSSPT